MEEDLEYNPELYHSRRLKYSSRAIDFIKHKTSFGPNSRVIDVACGTGILLDEFLDASYVLGIDKSAEMLAFAEKRHIGQHRRPMLLNADAHCLPLPNGFADIVVVGHAIHLFDLGLFLQEVKRLLRPRGWLVTISRYPSGKEPYRPLYMYLLHKWAEASSKAVPRLLNTEDVGIGYIASLERLGFDHYQRVVFEAIVNIDIEEYIMRGEDHYLYREMSEQSQRSYKAELRSKLQQITSATHIAELNYDYVSLAQTQVE
jgi:ubiquinone/menaquinone biosynthesis C-methylase UbiE